MKELLCATCKDAASTEIWEAARSNVRGKWSMTVIAILMKASLSLNQLKTRGRGSFKEGKRERTLCTSVDLRLAAETRLCREARLKVMTKVQK